MVLERVLRDTRLRVVVIDPNSDYVGLDELDGVRGVEGSPDPGSVTVFQVGGARGFLRLDYSGGWGTYKRDVWKTFKNTCRAYDGPS